MFHHGDRVRAKIVQFVEDIASEGFKFGEQVLGYIRKAGKVFFGDNQRVPKDKLAQSRLGVEILGFIDDFVLRIRRVRHLWYRTKQTIHPESPFCRKNTPSYTHFRLILSWGKRFFYWSTPAALPSAPAQQNRHLPLYPFRDPGDASHRRFEAELQGAERVEVGVRFDKGQQARSGLILEIHSAFL
jgi:hypothetical protein